MKRMRIRKMINISIKDKLLITFILVFLCTFIIFKYINKGVKNVLSVYAVNEIKTESTLLINESINNLEVGNYEEYINVVKNKDDEIISVDFNSQLINKNLVEINNKIYKSLKLLETGEYNFTNDLYIERNRLTYQIPLGLITGSPALANLGPRVPFKARIIGNVVSNIKTEITPYGINNSLLKIYIDVTVNSRLSMPFISEEINTLVSTPIVIKLINGRIPNVYGGAYSVTSPFTSSN